MENADVVGGSPGHSRKRRIQHLYFCCWTGWWVPAQGYFPPCTAPMLCPAAPTCCSALPRCPAAASCGRRASKAFKRSTVPAALPPQHKGSRCRQQQQRGAPQQGAANSHVQKQGLGRGRTPSMLSWPLHPYGPSSRRWSPSSWPGAEQRRRSSSTSPRRVPLPRRTTRGLRCGRWTPGECHARMPMARAAVRCAFPVHACACSLRS